MIEEGGLKTLIRQGAEAKLYSSQFFGRPIIIKERFSKKYRHPVLDESLTKERTKAEAKYLVKCRKFGIYTPIVYFVDLDEGIIYMENIIGSKTVTQELENIDLLENSDSNRLNELSEKIGSTIGQLHKNNVIHGDLTTSNMLLRDDKLILIDFGLSFTDTSEEDKAVDLYILERAITSLNVNCHQFLKHILLTYKNHYPGSELVLNKLDEVRMRGRKRTMVG